jgi:SAM-dependent methyltransferase
LGREEDRVNDFYDRLSPFYHLIYPDWEASVAWQAERLQSIIQRRWGEGAKTILDVSCGIGTQSIGLAARGFDVTASDLSPAAVARARREAEARGLSVRLSVCDMREVHRHHGGGFDVVISADNSVPHLLGDEEILVALRAMQACLRPGGGCVITMRAYDREERGKGLIKPYGMREVEGKRYFIWQVWDFEGEQYTLSLYFIEDDQESGEATTHVMRSRYYAIHPDHLLKLMERAGFEAVARLDDAFFQPVLVGTKSVNECRAAPPDDPLAPASA